MSKEKPMLLTCQTCGREPIDEQGHGFRCRFCLETEVYTGTAGEPWYEKPDEWNARQFKARHEAIDRIMLAIIDNGPALAAARKNAEEGEHASETIQRLCTELHESNLARRRAEAERLMGGDA